MISKAGRNSEHMAYTSMEFEVEVTQEDIDQGVRKDNCNCPVALAVKRATGREDVSVARNTIALGRDVIFRVKKICDFVFDFDEGKPVEPFTFTVKV